jgi:hypothetical protein
MSGPYPNWEKVKHGIFKLFVWGFVVVSGLMLLGYWLTTEKQRLAHQYHVSQDKIVVEPRPHGCDFDDAPLGNKHCHYEKVVDTERVYPGAECRVTGVYESWHRVDE